MTEKVIALGIDPSKAKSGAEQVKREMRGIGTEAQKTQRALDDAGIMGAASLNNASAAAKATNAALGVAAKAALGFAAAFASLRTVEASIRSVLGFSKALAEESTILPDAARNISALEAEARRLTATFGGSTTEQAKVFYQAISAGASDVARANEILEASNKLAIGGVTDTGNAVGGLTSDFNAYGSKVESATAVSDAMFVAMSEGNTTIGELSASLNKVTPLATSSGLSFDELASSITVAKTSTEKLSTSAITAAKEIGEIGVVSSQVDKFVASMRSAAATVNELTAGVIELARKIFDIPDRVVTIVVNEVRGSVVSPASTAATSAVEGVLDTDGRANFALGGIIRGPGTGTSDSVAIRASAGEFIVNAAAAKRHGALLKAINNAPRFADGGFVGSIPDPTSPNYDPRAFNNHSAAQDGLPGVFASFMSPIGYMNPGQGISTPFAQSGSGGGSDGVTINNVFNIEGSVDNNTAQRMIDEFRNGVQDMVRSL